MRQLTPSGQAAVHDIAQRHGFSVDAVLAMLEAVVHGNGGLAQFSHAEFGGSGQWMRGGMTMVGDMFNGQLRNRVANLCEDLARLVESQPDMLRAGSFQSQSQNGQQQFNGQHGGQGWGGGTGDAGQGAGFFAPPPPDWWGPELQWPTTTGSQNGMRYAWFAQARRLALESQGRVTVYDTLDHDIGGVSQQQGGRDAIVFTSQYGAVDPAQLPVVSMNGAAPPPWSTGPGTAPLGGSDMPAQPESWAAPLKQGGGPAPSAGEADIYSHIERLADLHSRGILTLDEFTAKKAELLGRI